MGIGMRELIVILLVCLVVFGAKKLRTVGSDLGQAVRGFKKAVNEGENEDGSPFAKQVASESPDRVAAKVNEAAKTADPAVETPARSGRDL